jgi:hypothetical protein
MVAARDDVGPPRPDRELGELRSAGRFRMWWRTYHWWVVAIAAFAALLLGAVGFSDYAGTAEGSVLDDLYLSLQLFVLQSGAVDGPRPPVLEVARWLAPLVAAYAALALVAAIAEEELVGLRNRFRSGHVVVCGLGAGWALTRMLRARGQRVVVIEKDGSHPQIERCRVSGVPVLIGDARDDMVLRRAGIEGAGQVFVVCGDDGVNMKVAERARRLARSSARDAPLRVLVHVEDPYLCNLLAIRELEHDERAGRDGRDVRIDYFSVYAGGARSLLDGYPPVGIQGGRDRPHLLVVGLGRLGRQLVVQAARNWRAQEHHGHERLWITVASHPSEAGVDWLRARHPFLDATCELHGVPLPADVVTLLHRPAPEQPDCPPVSNVFVCLPDDAEGLMVGLALERGCPHPGVPVVVRTYDANLGALLPGRAATDDGGIVLFEHLDRAIRPEQLFLGVTEVLARAVHDTYVRQRRAAGDTPDTNPSIVAWDDLPADKKESNFGLAECIPEYLVAVGCQIGPLADPGAELFEFEADEVELIGRLEHLRWRRQHRSDRCVGSARDHDDVSWQQLPEGRKEIDRTFARRIPALLATVGYQVNRVATGGVSGSRGSAAPGA